MQTILSVVGARPNFMKLAPLAVELTLCRDVRHVIVHTGQHYDADMSADFFDDLGIPKPDYNLAVGSWSHAKQTAAIMERLEPVCLGETPNVVLVYGDVNSALAAALVASKLGIRVGHVEAGLRSNDWSMPEEINRVLTDRLSDLLFTPSPDAGENLIAEGIAQDKIHFVGNIMIDSLVRMLPAARRLNAPSRFGVAPSSYIVATLHRPSNVDDSATLCEVITALQLIGREKPVLFPAHPRTRARLSEMNVSMGDGVRLLDPLSYLEMLGLVSDAAMVITDSGGLQEETTYLGVPCLTIRPNTERPITCVAGTNRLVAPQRDAILKESRLGLRRRPESCEIERWDGHAGNRIAAVLCSGARF